mmetsp:Transcript_32095/g.49074  ORF Transcript_32095/g.49074 Transcript_32095/m.49074 type:complete len:227 (+) Transcript_32095:17-697(+)
MANGGYSELPTKTREVRHDLAPSSHYDSDGHHNHLSNRKSMRSFFKHGEPHSAGTLGTWGTVLGILSTVVGGGIVSIPYSFYQCGFVFAIGFCVFNALQVLLSSALFLKVREMCPSDPSSMFEIGFIILGRSAIYWISVIILANSLGLIIIYFSVFGENASLLMTNLFWQDVPEEEPNFGMKPVCWILCLSVLLIPFVLKKELAEMKGVSVTLFAACIVFVIVNTL